MEVGRDDRGVVVGLADVRRLLTEIPNKINSSMAILADVELRSEDGLEYLVVTVDPYPYPISYHGKYYLRSGATNRELTGRALDDFILRRQGKTWDGVPVPRTGVGDLDVVAFRDFRRKALASARLAEEDLEVTGEALIDSLLLSDGDYLKRAAVLVFHENPEKWVLGAHVKIGYFENDADLVFQDEVHGPLVSMADKVLDLLYSKYFKGVISYDGIQRIETFPVPRAACREAVLNAIVHRDYSTGVPIQIKVFPDEVVIYNDGVLPENWTVAQLVARHRSMPHNPGIANVFFRSGMIETWGRGIEKIKSACREAGQPEPVFDAGFGEVKVSFPITATSPPSGKDLGYGQVQAVEQVLEEVNEQVMSMLLIARTPVPRSTLLAAGGLKDAYLNYQNHIVPLLERDLLARTIPDRPTARTQRYVLTELGRAAVERMNAAK